MSEVQGNHKYTKPKAMLSKSTFLLFDSSLPRRYYNILSALDCLVLLGCNHRLSQKQSHFKTRMRFSCPHVICTWTSTRTFTCCATEEFTHRTEHTEGVQWQRCMLSPTRPCMQVPHLAKVGPPFGTACSSQSSPSTTVRYFQLPQLQLLQRNAERGAPVPCG